MKKILNFILRLAISAIVFFTVLSFDLIPPKPGFEWLQYVQWFGIGIIVASISSLIQKQLFD